MEVKDHAKIRANRAKKAERNATPRQRRERARRQAMGIALIQRPLRFIGDKTNAVKMIDGKPKVVASPDFELACRFARDGYGPAVQHIARRVMHSLS